MILETILSVAAGLYTLISKITLDRQRVSREQRDAIATVLSSIATTLTHAADSIATHDVPHGDCAALAHYAAQLPHVLTGAVPESDAAYYADLLHRAHHVEQLALVTRDADTTSVVTALRDAAGTYTAAAVLITAH